MNNSSMQFVAFFYKNSGNKKKKAHRNCLKILPDRKQLKARNPQIIFLATKIGRRNTPQLKVKTNGEDGLSESLGEREKRER
jgi:hypothetical protein